MLPPVVQCLPPPAPAAWIMAPHAPDLTRRMLNELSPSPTKATVD
ncbi:lysis system o-spanin lipoprotein Rz1 [Pseudomonas brassicacearum]